MLRTVILPALLVLVFSLSLCTSADARRWRYHNIHERADRNDGDSARAARAIKLLPIRGTGALSVVVERLISGCGQQADELENLPFATIARIAAPNEAQGGALDALRETATQAAERLASDCPQSVPAEPAARLEAVERAIDAALRFGPLISRPQWLRRRLRRERAADPLHCPDVTLKALVRGGELKVDDLGDLAIP